MKKKKILIIDDDTYICDLIVNFLAQHNYQVEGTYKGNSGIKKALTEKFSLVVCDYRLPDTDGMEVLKKIKEKSAAIPVIIMTAYSDVRLAVKLIKMGALDYVTKPIYPEELLQLIDKTLNKGKGMETPSSFSENFIIGKSKKMFEVVNYIEAVAPTDISVLIQGETGSGKEYVAKAIHYQSTRKNKPFIPVDCGALPKELANSELFGHIKGAFTGAINDKKGYFEEANGGTLFLDEIGNLNYEVQVKLLRALQEGVVYRIGENKKIHVDVRIITATNEDLMQEVNENKFREDLYHRINGFKINIPALRHRKEDIMIFADYFLNKSNADFGKNIEGFSDDVQRIFHSYPWYGNLRELENVIKRCVLLSGRGFISEETLPDELKYETGHQQTPTVSFSDGAVTELREATLEAEKEVIANALKESNYNKSKAAKMLNIDRKTLYNKIKQYDISTVKG